jgi:DNA-binding transcriptional MerR regulator
MSTQSSSNKTYTIRETAGLTGLPESTLRYYESIGIIGPVRRDTSSKHRVFSEDNLDMLVAVACLNATGLSLEDMRSYMNNRSQGSKGAREQVDLLTTQAKRLVDEAKFLKLRQQYVDLKISYWEAIAVHDDERRK